MAELDCLGNLGRRLVLLMRIVDSGSLTNLQQRLVRTGVPFDKACPVLPVAAGGEPSDAPALRQHATEDPNAVVASGIGGPQSTADLGDRIGRKRISV